MNFFTLALLTLCGIASVSVQSIGCGDQHTSCAFWAERGQCQTNPDYMLITCSSSCKNCPESGENCADQNAQCVGWSRRGECERNPSYMRATCPKSCGSCPTGGDSTSIGAALLRKTKELRCGSFNHTVGSNPTGVISFPVGPVASITTGGRFKRAVPIIAGGAPGDRDFSNAGGIASISSGSSSSGGSIFGGSGGGSIFGGSGGGSIFGGSGGGSIFGGSGGGSIFGGSGGGSIFGGSGGGFLSRGTPGGGGSFFGGSQGRPPFGSFGGRPPFGSFGGGPSFGSSGGIPSFGSFGGRPPFGNFGSRPPFGSFGSFPSGGFGVAAPTPPFQIPRQEFQQPPFPPANQPSFQSARPNFRPGAQTFRPAAQTFRPAAQTFRPAAQTFRPAAQTFRPATQTFRPAAPTFQPATLGFGPGTGGQFSRPSQPSNPAFSLPPDAIRDSPDPSVTSNEVALDDFFCGASLVSDQHLLTAAHCVTNQNNKPREITFREVSRNSGDNRVFSVSYEIESVIVHPEYKKESPIRYHDLAILKTRNQIQFGPVTWPYCLPPPGATVDFKTLTVSGWGKVNSSYISENLQQARVPAIPNSICEGNYEKLELGDSLRLRYPQGLTDSLLCAGQAGKDACEGDSGGPLTYHDEEGREILIGVVSTGLPCSDSPLLPGIYVNVAKYIDWINNIISG